MAIPNNYIDKITKDDDTRIISPAADVVRVNNDNFEGSDLDGVLDEVAAGLDAAAPKSDTYTKQEVREQLPLRIPATQNGDVITSTISYATILNAVNEDERDAYVVLAGLIYQLYQADGGIVTFSRTDSEDDTQAYLSVGPNGWTLEYGSIGAGGYEPPVGGIPKTDLATDVQTSLGKADTALQSETDPTVSAWAKSPTKPSYTFLEVGALPANTPIPSKTSDLTNDSGFTSNTGTITGITMNGASKGTSGVVDLGTVITSHQDISGKADKSEVNAKQDTLVSGANIKTINNTSLLGQGNMNLDMYASSSTTQDGTFIITLTSGDTITVDLNHEHQQYLKYQLLADEAAYTALATKDSSTLYLIPES